MNPRNEQVCFCVCIMFFTGGEREMDMDAKQQLGIRLRTFRMENGYSQSHLANVLGIERSTYTYYETGKTTPVVFDLMRMADLYNVTLDELLGFHADSSDPLAFGEPREPVKAVVRVKDRYLNEAVQDISLEERQLLAYYRSAQPSERHKIIEFIRSLRRSDHRRSL